MYIFYIINYICVLKINYHNNHLTNMTRYILAIILFFQISSFFAQNKTEYKVVCIGFYNLENLFDTIVDTNPNIILADEFTPKGKNVWTGEKYWEKIENMAKVISDMGTEQTPDGPAVLGVSEVENISVLEDLVKSPLLKDRNYKIVHYDSPDRRGIDVGFLYQEKYFKLTSSSSHTLTLKDDTTFHTRDQLLVTGTIDNEVFNFIICHWPSRRGGEKRSMPLRIAAADLSRSIIDSLNIANPNSKTVLMGDLNDDPTSTSIKVNLNTAGEEAEITEGKLYNPMEPLFKKGLGTLAYRDVWNLFDQIIITPNFVGEDKKDFKFYKAEVYNKEYLKQKSGKYKGYPLRTYAGGIYIHGYSDHFPSLIYIIKEK